MWDYPFKGLFLCSICVFISFLPNYLFLSSFSSQEPVLRIRDAYPGSRMLIFYPSRIPDPKTAMKDRGEQKIVVIPCFWSYKFHKIELGFFNVEEKNLGQFSKNYRTCYPKIVTKLSKIGVWDPGSGKNLFRIPDPVSRGQKSTGSRIPDPDPQHCQ